MSEQEKRFLAGYLTADEFAAEIKRTEQTLRRWRRKKRGPPYVEGPGGVLYPLEEGREWLRSNLVQPQRAKV